MNQQEQFEEWRILTPEEVAQREARKRAAIRAAQGTPGTCTKHLRLSIDFHITIAGTPPDDDGLNEPDTLYHARQERLLTAAKGNSAVLERWIKSLIVNQMQQKACSDWDTLIGGEVAFQDLLAPALATLPKDDQEYFAFIPEGMYFDDLINLFSASFTITEDAPVIREQGDET